MNKISVKDLIAFITRWKPTGFILRIFNLLLLIFILIYYYNVSKYMCAVYTE